MKIWGKIWCKIWGKFLDKILGWKIIKNSQLVIPNLWIHHHHLREFALCYSRHPGDMRGRSRVWDALWETLPRAPVAPVVVSQNRAVVGASHSKMDPILEPKTLSQTPPPSRVKTRFGRVWDALWETLPRAPRRVIYKLPIDRLSGCYW